MRPEFKIACGLSVSMFVPILYTCGSLSFLAASLFLHPTFNSSALLPQLATAGFICGGSLFLLAGTLGLRSALGSRPRQLPRTGQAVLTLLGACLLLGGSMAFLPTFSPQGATVGTYTFRCGSICYICSSLWSLIQLLRTVPRTPHHGRLRRHQIGALVAYLSGSSLFITGGACFLLQIPAVASSFWMLGSSCFLLGSSVHLRLAHTGWQGPRAP
jgi:hypothetical protein